MGLTMFLRWRQIDAEDRPRIWLMYGWFSGLIFVGSVFGALSWAFWMQNLVANYSGSVPGLTLAQSASWNARGQYWTAAFLCAYAVEFLCLSTAKLMVLDRMMDFVVKRDDMTRRLALAGRLVLAVVVVGNIVGFCGNVAAAVYYRESGDLNNAAAAAFATSAEDGFTFASRATERGGIAATAQSVQQAGEVVVLLIIIAAFAFVGAASVRRVEAALRSSQGENEALARKIRRQIVGTTAFVFTTFLLRAVFAIMNALANGLSNSNAGIRCNPSDLCDPSCFNVFALVQYWLILTPEFQLTVILISSPLSSLVALWGMTSDRALQLMKTTRGEVSLRNMAEAR